MKGKLSLIAILFTFISLYFFFPSHATAIAKFSTDYQNYYRVDPNGNTHVSFIINQKNNLSVVYATDFGININETKIENVKVTDEGITVIPEIVKTLNQTTISFPFANKVVGKDKVHSFTIEYDTTDITTKFGSTWQINIPRLEADENVASQAVVLSVPTNFPTPAYIDPQPDSVANNVYYFSGSKLGNKAISAVFGQSQFYKVDISYHLVNDSKSKIVSEIALPPDTAYQTVYIKNLVPKPISVYIDQDGNYLAKYQLEPETNLEIKLEQYLKINFTPKSTNTPPNETNLSSNSTWNYENGVFTTPELKNLTSPKTIYDFVVDKLRYDYEKVNRQKSQKTPAAESLLNFQSAICTDFSNVFVALARKAKIPARELEGFAISENTDLKPTSITQDVLHAWPEYFNSSNNTWTQIDPTWANTTRGIDYFNKLDFNHLVFVIHGSDPDYPIPAGAYKYKQEKTKDIAVNPVEAITFPDPSFSLAKVDQDFQSITLRIDNLSGVGFSGNTIVEKNDWLSESEQNLMLPPFGETKLNLKLLRKPFIRSIDTKVIIYINGQRFEQPVTVYPTVSKTVIFTIVGLILGVIAFIARHLYLRRRKQKTALYR